MNRLLMMYPLPWVIEQNERVNPDNCAGGFTIASADGKVIMDGGTYTGDGDIELNLDRLQAAELVELVNSLASPSGEK